MRILVLIMLWLGMSFAVLAQDNYRISSYGVDDGLPQNSIWSITQDRNGFLWFSTSDGLCRFDGYKFTVYKNNPKDTSSICSNEVKGFYVDKKGNLWVICSNGIAQYNDMKDNFKTIFTYQTNLPSNFFNAIFGEDEQFIWAGLSKYGLVKVDKRTLKVTPINSVSNYDLGSIRAWSGGFVEGGKVWICNNIGLCYYDTRKNEMVQVYSEQLLSSIINLNDSEVLAGGDSKLIVCDKKTHTPVVQPINFDRKTQAVISYMLPISKDQVLLACHKGLFYYDIRLREIVKSITSFDTQQKNKYAYARCLYCDKANNIWIGTNGDGLKKMNYPYKKFLAYNSHSETSNLVKSIYADSQRVYVGYFNNGMDIFDRESGFWKNLSFLKLGYSYGTHVYAVNRLDANELVVHIATQNRLFVYNTSNNRIRPITPLLKKILPDIEHVETMYSFLLRQSNGQILTVIGSYLVALNDPHSTKIKPSFVHRFGDETLSCCYEDNKNTLWVGTMNCLYYYREGQWNKVNLTENVQVKSMNKDREGNLWVGTVKGMYVLDSAMKVTSYFSETNGLANQFIYGILRDDDGNMWFSHNKGLTVYRKKTKEFRHYYKEDGLQSSEFNTNAYFKTADGTLFFGGLNGINAFNPREILDNPNVPSVKITSIKLFDEPLRTDTAYWNIHTITLPYNQNSLSFEFSAVEFTNPANNQYAYILEGVDNTWIRSGDKRFARYAALSPGKYTFKVKASNNDNIWQETPTVIEIVILPPFWQRLWFRILCLLVLTGSVAGIIYRIQLQRHIRQIRALELQQKIQLERERISRDLHDNVGTQLSLISNNVEWVVHPLKTISEDEKTEKLLFVNETARDIIATLRETIWALNKQEIPLEEFSDKLKAFVQKQLTIYPEIELNFIEKIEVAIILGPSEALNLFRICQEAIANALKYASATAIDIEIGTRWDKYKVSITDNGKGFDISTVSPALQNGLENMKHRAQDIDCQLGIHSDNRGTKITITKK